jgi:hypothetical protein
MECLAFVSLIEMLDSFVELDTVVSFFPVYSVRQSLNIFQGKVEISTAISEDFAQESINVLCFIENCDGLLETIFRYGKQIFGSPDLFEIVHFIGFVLNE